MPNTGAMLERDTGCVGAQSTACAFLTGSPSIAFGTTGSVNTYTEAAGRVISLSIPGSNPRPVCLPGSTSDDVERCVRQFT